MSKPRITGLLNNCALNCALPILLAGIEQLAQHEQNASIATLPDNTILQSYLSLKRIFARYYGVEDESNLTWQAFSSFLKKHSFYANEIIFAPILRNFIATIAPEHQYHENDLWLLRDMQDDGRYNPLDATEAMGLLYDQFGIDLYVYEINQDWLDYKATFRKRSKNLPYLFEGERPVLHMYLKQNHFEIQPYEFLAEANRAYSDEIDHLDEGLAAIHDQLSSSATQNQSNRAIGKLVVYGQNALRAHLASLSESLSASSAMPASTEPNDVIPSVNRSSTDAVPPNGLSGLADAALTKYGSPDKDPPNPYSVTAEQYARTGQDFHNDTPSGRLTFAVILLTIHQQDKNTKADSILESIASLAAASDRDEPLAAYLLDKLAKETIRSPMNLNSNTIQNVIDEIRDHQDANEAMQRIIEQGTNNQHFSLVCEARVAIGQAWKQYKETHDEGLIVVIKKTQKMAQAPSPSDCDTYKSLAQELSAKGGWGKVIAGFMFSVLGLALIVCASLSLAASFGASAPLSIPAVSLGASALVVGLGSLYGGAALFSASKDTRSAQKVENLTLMPEDACTPSV